MDITTTVSAPQPLVSLEAIRLQKGATQAQVAKKLGVTQGTVSKWERADLKDMNIRRVVDYLWALDMSVEFVATKKIASTP
jgi:transcriptional regulator with XRE-family HTH domain